MHCGFRRFCSSGAVGVAAGVLALRSRRASFALPPEPKACFGVVADVQYADVDDAWNFRRTQKRRYRGALEALKLAVEDWKKGPPLLFIADLGDIIDQQCEANNDSERALQLVLDAWQDAPAHVVHLMGNHELYNFNREEAKTLIPNIFPWYRRLQLVPGWRFLILDAYDLNVIEKGGGPAVEEGIAYISEHNPNDLRAPRGTIDMSAGLSGLQKRFVPMGGGIKPEQLQWLREELEDAAASGDRAVVLTHLPVRPEATVAPALLWNYDDILQVFRDFAGVVPLVLAGHYHEGGYAWDPESLTHHVTLPSPLNAPEDKPTAHGLVELWDDKIVIRGHGIVPSRDLSLVPPCKL
ncbi:unnamed protein product [Durusdinium trenchii]|uniref:Manganese-dependent ADP-ribose/CDP-alcohol diphosphatase (ADPRibase-Mn) (CDP-choline phosphohydrolase) n=3 Tax=Durusdinium trenchii TaxID=1381693 RepID=A0ABP0QZA9_9DINO